MITIIRDGESVEITQEELDAISYQNPATEG